MALSDVDQILINLPNGVNLTINGVPINPQDVLDLDEVGSSVPLALAYIFRALESDNLQSETIGEWSGTKYGMKASEFWEQRAASAAMSNNAPNVILRPGTIRGFGGYGCP